MHEVTFSRQHVIKSLADASIQGQSDAFFAELLRAKSRFGRAERAKLAKTPKEWLRERDSRAGLVRIGEGRCIGASRGILSRVARDKGDVGKNRSLRLIHSFGGLSGNLRLDRWRLVSSERGIKGLLEGNGREARPKWRKDEHESKRERQETHDFANANTNLRPFAAQSLNADRSVTVKVEGPKDEVT